MCMAVLSRNRTLFCCVLSYHIRSAVVQKFESFKDGLIHAVWIHDYLTRLCSAYEPHPQQAFCSIMLRLPQMWFPESCTCKNAATEHFPFQKWRGMSENDRVAFKLLCMNVGIGWGRQDAGHGIWTPDQENSSGYQARSSDSHDQVRLVYMFCAIWEFAQSGDCVAYSIPISRLHNLRMHTIVDIEDS